LLSLQARIVKLICRLTVKGPMKRPPRTPLEGIVRLRAALGRYDGYNRRVTRGLHVTNVASPVPGEWLRSDADSRDAAILFVHGGGYVACSPRSHRALTTALARDSSVALFAVDYRLAPENPFPAALDDVLAAYDAIVSGGIRANRIVLAGDSAGGGLVLSAGLAIKARGDGPGLAGTIAYSPWTDLLATGDSIRTNADSDDMLVGAGVAPSARNYARSDDDVRNPLASPLYGDLAGLAPTLVFASRSEILRDDAVRFAERARNQGSPVELELADGMPHVWPIFVDVMPEAKRAVARSVAFIRDVLDAAV
jgi:acetyl esterase/lipase